MCASIFSGGFPFDVRLLLLFAYFLPFGISLINDDAIDVVYGVFCAFIQIKYNLYGCGSLRLVVQHMFNMFFDAERRRV